MVRLYRPMPERSRSRARATSAPSHDAPRQANGFATFDTESDVAVLEQQHRAAVLAADLRASRRRGRDALVRHQPRHLDSWTDYVLPAARQIEETLTAFLDFDAVWDSMRGAEIETGMLDDDLVGAVSIVFDQDLVGLLEYLGYTPPPLAEEWAIDVTEAVTAVLGHADSALATRTTTRARRDLKLFLLRLASCIEQAQADLDATPQDVSPSVRRRLVHALHQGVLVAAPAVVATSAVAYAFPTEAAVAGLGLALHAGAREALKMGVFAATGRLVSRGTAGADTQALPVELVAAETQRVVEVGRSLATVLRHPGPGTHPLVRPMTIETVSAAYALRAALLQVPISPDRTWRAERLDETVQLLSAMAEQIEDGRDSEGHRHQVEESVVRLIETLGE